MGKLKNEKQRKQEPLTSAHLVNYTRISRMFSMDVRPLSCTGCESLKMDKRSCHEVNMFKQVTAVQSRFHRYPQIFIDLIVMKTEFSAVQKLQ